HVIIDGDAALGWLFQPGNGAQQGGFAAARGTQQGNHFAFVQAHGDPFQNGVAVVGQVDIVYSQLGHRSFTPKRNAMVRPMTTRTILIKDRAATMSMAPVAHRETSMEPMVSVPGVSRYTPVEYSRSKIRNISNQEPIRPNFAKGRVIWRVT